MAPTQRCTIQSFPRSNYALLARRRQSRFATYLGTYRSRQLAARIRYNKEKPYDQLTAPVAGHRILSLMDRYLKCQVASRSVSYQGHAHRQRVPSPNAQIRRVPFPMEVR